MYILKYVIIKYVTAYTINTGVARILLLSTGFLYVFKHFYK